MMTKKKKITNCIMECLECGIFYSGYYDPTPKCSDCYNKKYIKARDELVKSQVNKTDLK
jgi:hypothetical protein